MVVRTLQRHYKTTQSCHASVVQLPVVAAFDPSYPLLYS
jgi:hypothetical protein